MPIYEYVCQECGHQLERIQKLSDPPAQDCPECGKPSLKKKISAAAFRLKGGGWYETDFKSGDKKKNLAKDSDSDSKPASSEGGSAAAKSSDSKAPSSNTSASSGASSSE